MSELTHSTIALVLAGGRGSRLKQLTAWRCKPAVPFGGKFRIIDFTLSNCVAAVPVRWNSAATRLSINARELFCFDMSAGRRGRF